MRFPPEPTGRHAAGGTLAANTSRKRPGRARSSAEGGSAGESTAAEVRALLRGSGQCGFVSEHRPGKRMPTAPSLQGSSGVGETGSRANTAARFPSARVTPDARQRRLHGDHPSRATSESPHFVWRRRWDFAGSATEDWASTAPWTSGSGLDQNGGGYAELAPMARRPTSVASPILEHDFAADPRRQHGAGERHPVSSGA